MLLVLGTTGIFTPVIEGAATAIGAGGACSWLTLGLLVFAINLRHFLDRHEHWESEDD
jgi:hypothetical protein